MKAATVAEAIAIVKDSRSTHVAWMEWIIRGQASPLEIAISGDLEHHVEAIVGYDRVIAVLETFL